MSKRSLNTEGCLLAIVLFVLQTLFFLLFYWIFKDQLHAPTWAAFGFAYLIAYRDTKTD